MRKFLVIFILHLPFLLNAQIWEDFEDAEFHNNPQWLGDTSLFFVNAQKQLQTKLQNLSGQSFLSTQNPNLFNTEWTFLVGLSFSPSSSNQLKIFLACNTPILTDSTKAYFFQIGEDGNEDSYDLYKIVNGKKTKIIDGIVGHANRTSQFIQIKIQRDPVGNWNLFSDTLMNNDFFLEGTCIDTSIRSSSYFIFNPIFSATRSDKFFFDNLSIKELNVNELPKLVSYNFIDLKNIRLQFSSPINAKTFSKSSFFYVDKNKKLSLTASANSLNQQELILNSIQNFPIDTLISVQFDTVFFNYNKILFNGSFKIKKVSLMNKIMISELLPDPNPTVDLPDREFIELYNNSPDTIELKNLVLSDLTSKAYFGNEFIFPYEYLILVDNNADSSYEKFGRVLYLSGFPSLNNSSDVITLKEMHSNRILDSLKYSSTWFRDPSKATGGYTLERIFNNCNCLNGSNWVASLDSKGGTPGKKNTANTFSHLYEFLFIDGVRVLNSMEVEINFSSGFKFDKEKINIQFEDAEELKYSLIDSSEQKKIHIKFLDTLERNKFHKASIQGIIRCSGEENPKLFFEFALLSELEKGDLLINEILPNPYPGANDFVELYNKSDKIINLKNIFIANEWPFSISKFKKLSDNDFYLRPSEYLVITDNKENIEFNYFCEPNTKFSVLKTLPSFNNDAGKVFISKDSILMDSAHYMEGMHSALLNNVEGVSLERVSPSNNSMDQSNWRSASSQNNYASPGRKNSQYEENINDDSKEIVIDRPYVSPDNDGLDDYVSIQINLKTEEALLNIDIFDLRGIEVKNLISSTYIKNSQIFIWDGLGKNNTILNNGIYLFQFHFFFPNGDQKIKRVPIVVFRNT